MSPQTQVAHGEDAEFLLDALRSSKAEMQMGELAQQRSKNAAVQQFGEKLRADHAKAADEIETLLEPLNMNVPAEPSTEQQSHYAALAKLSGEEFDRAFVEAQTDANPKFHGRDAFLDGLRTPLTPLELGRKPVVDLLQIATFDVHDAAIAVER